MAPTTRTFEQFVDTEGLPERQSPCKTCVEASYGLIVMNEGEVIRHRCHTGATHVCFGSLQMVRLVNAGLVPIPEQAKLKASEVGANNTGYGVGQV